MSESLPARLTTRQCVACRPPLEERGTLRSTAAAEAALANREASVLALHEEFLVGHDRLPRVPPAAVLHVGLIVGDAGQQTRGGYRPLHQRHNLRLRSR